MLEGTFLVQEMFCKIQQMFDKHTNIMNWKKESFQKIPQAKLGTGL